MWFSQFHNFTYSELTLPAVETIIGNLIRSLYSFNYLYNWTFNGTVKWSSGMTTPAQTIYTIATDGCISWIDRWIIYSHVNILYEKTGIFFCIV